MKFLFSILTLFLSSQLAIAQLKITELQNGDIIFFGKGNSQLSGAISDVTQTHLATTYSHMGIIEMQDTLAFLLHSGSQNGTERILLTTYLQQGTKEKTQVDVFRIQDISVAQINTAIKIGKSLLGKPYNFSYVMNESSYYCSDFVWTCFAADSIFNLNPMTFKKENSSEFHPSWVAYYEKIGIPIPEGFPGCNPNGMAADESLLYIGNIEQD